MLTSGNGARATVEAGHRKPPTPATTQLQNRLGVGLLVAEVSAWCLAPAPRAGQAGGGLTLDSCPAGGPPLPCPRPLAAHPPRPSHCRRECALPQPRLQAGPIAFQAEQAGQGKQHEGSVWASTTGCNDPCGEGDAGLQAWVPAKEGKGRILRLPKARQGLLVPSQGVPWERPSWLRRTPPLAPTLLAPAPEPDAEGAWDPLGACD